MYALGVFSRIKIYGLKKKLICYLSLNCMQISCSHFQSVICIYNFFFPTIANMYNFCKERDRESDLSIFASRVTHAEM